MCSCINFTLYDITFWYPGISGKYLENIFKHVMMELLFRPAEGYFCDRSFILELDHQEVKKGLCGDPE